jgi:signal transduction histidine kinase
MTDAQYLVTTAILGILIGIVMIRFQVRHPRPWYHYWVLSWFSSAVFAVSYLTYLFVTRDLAGTHPGRLAVAVVSQLSSLLHEAWLILGTILLTNKTAAPRRAGRVIVASCAILSVAVVFGVGFSPENALLRYFMRTGVRAFFEGAALMATGAWLVLGARRRPGQMGRVVVTVAFFATAVLHLYQAILASGFALGIAELPAVYLGLPESVLSAVTGIGLIVWLLEDLNADLEERVRSRTHDLVLANEELEAFNRIVSHDLKGPLWVIDEYSRDLRDSHGSAMTEGGRTLLSGIRQSGKEMGDLIDALMSFARTQSEAMTMDWVDMKVLAEEAFSTLGEAKGGREVEFVLGDLPTIPGDAGVLRLVWTNLLGNALKFTAGRDNPRVEVSCVREEGSVVFRVADNGVGFHPDRAPELFQVFKRLHDPTEFPGTGVGLASVKRIVLRHKGEVWASGVVNGGAEIYFRLPDSNESLDS